MSQDFEFTEQHPPHEPLKPAASPPLAPASASPSRPQTPGRPAAVEADPLYRSPLSVGAGLILLLAMSGAIGYLGYDSYKNPPAAPAAPDAPGVAPAPVAKDEPNPAPAAAPSPTPGTDLAAEVEQLKNALKATTGRFDEMTSKLAADSGPLQDRLAAIESAQKSLAGLPARLAALDEKVGSVGKPEASGEATTRIDAVDKRVGDLSQAIDAIRSEVATLARSAAQPGATPAGAKPAEDPNAAEKALSQGSELFNQKKYAESLDVFTRLQAEQPDDARVWYYSALANGLATTNWAGETVKLVNRGIEREKAGTPETGKIDAAFSGLTDANGKKWLAAYRARAAMR